MTASYLPAQTTVMILAAGQGKRMLPLTANTPKPLLKVGEYALIEHHLIRLQKLGFKHVVINIAYHATQIQQALGNGQQYGLNIHYSDESATGALETAGGICQALPLIDSDPFMVVNADIWTDFDFTKLLTPLKGLGRLVLVTNPPHNKKGDFTLSSQQTLGLIDKESTVPQNTLIQSSIPQKKTATFSGIALYKKALFADLPKDHLALAPVLRTAIQQNHLQGTLHQGEWQDIGTPERLSKLNQTYRKKSIEKPV